MSTPAGVAAGTLLAASGAGAARDEVLDAAGRVRPAWRQMLGTLVSLVPGVLQERQRLLDHAFEEDGVAGLLPNAPAGHWRCDPVPLLFSQEEFAALEAGLAQRATVLEAVLQDVYGAQTLLQAGLLPASLVFAGPRYLRACRATAGQRPPRQLQLYAADLLRRPDGSWCVLADRTAEPSGLAYALENRRMMARVVPELFRALEVSPLRPFLDVWQDALQRLCPPGPGNPGVALLTAGHADPLWFEHVLLARELSCELVEDGDLTVRDGAVYIKTLRGLQPVQVLLRRQGGATLDPLESDAAGVAGVPGLLECVRAGTVMLANAPGTALAEMPGLAPFLPSLCRHLLGETLLLPSVRTMWLGEAGQRHAVMAELGRWLLRSAIDGAGPAVKPAGLSAPGEERLARHLAERPWEYAAIEPVPPSFAPCVGAEGLEPRGVTLRLFLVWDGRRWRAMPGGTARVVSADDILAGRLPRHAVSKDVWVLQQDGADIEGPAHGLVAPLAVRRMAGDLPSRVADNFFWLGRYMERLENGARLLRALATRLSRASLTPRELPEVGVLVACLAEAGILDAETAPALAPGSLAEAMLRDVWRDDRAVAGQVARLTRMVALLRDRLTPDMYGHLQHGLRDVTALRKSLRPARLPASLQEPGLERLGALVERVLALSAAFAGYASETMTRGGGRLFLELGRRIERAEAVAGQLARVLDQQPLRLEAGLHLALELCDSLITYRSRYLTVLQPLPVLDLVLLDPGNPRGLMYQLMAASRVLVSLELSTATGLARLLEPMIAATRGMVDAVAGAVDQEAAASQLPPRLRALEQQMDELCSTVTRAFFTLLPVRTTSGMG